MRCGDQRYEEAAQHILDALVLQDSDNLRAPNDGRGATSDALWESFKTVCLHMHRGVLAGLCDTRDLKGRSGSFTKLDRKIDQWLDLREQPSASCSRAPASAIRPTWAGVGWRDKSQ